MNTIYVGVDVSKGYADIAIVNHAGSLLAQECHDDTAKGHREVLDLVRSKGLKTPDSQVIVGVEATGGLERNWMASFQGLAEAGWLKAYLLNPLAVKRFLDNDLHRNVSDKGSARGIARYLRMGMRPQEVPYEPHFQGQLTLYRIIRNRIKRRSQCKNELHALLPRVHPDLVQFCRDNLPQWVLILLTHYPTAKSLARAGLSKLKRLPYITDEKARKLIENAKNSVAAQTDTFTGSAVKTLAEEILHMGEIIDRLKKELCETMSEDEGVKRLQSIPGIGLWTAVCLRLEIGPVERFPSAEALTAYAGLDPRVDRSGDGVKHLGISKRGRRQIRAVLYTAALAGISCNPVLREFYARLRSNGKNHFKALTACMRKLLHIAYACWISDQDFNPEYEAQIKDKKEAAETVHQNENTELNESLSAPITRREANKRKAAAMSHRGGNPEVRDPGAAFGNNNARTKAKRPPRKVASTCDHS